MHLHASLHCDYSAACCILSLMLDLVENVGLFPESVGRDFFAGLNWCVES